MKLTSKSLRRGAVSIAIAGAAVLLPAVALASSAGSAPAAAAAGRCTRADLTSWVGEPGNGTAGSTFYALEISNISRHTCTLYGYPGVSAIGGGGKQLGSAASRAGGHAVRTVVLRPDQTAHVILRVTDVGVYSASACHPETAYTLRVYAPGDYHPTGFPFTLEACAKHGPAFLSVSTVLAGTGIPGYSH